MKLIFDQAVLEKVLAVVSRGIATKPPMPILNGILIDATDTAVYCSATDTELAIRMKVPDVQIGASGKLLISGKQFTDVVSSLSPGQIKLTADTNKVIVQSKQAEFELPSLSAADFPEMQGPSGVTYIVDADNLKTAIKQTIFATTSELLKPYLSSVLFEIKPGMLRLVATDARRITVKEIPVQSKISRSILVPVKSLKEIAEIIDGEVTFMIDDEQIFVMNQEITINSKLIIDQFPNYQQLIPQKFMGEIILERDAFIKSLERTSLVSESVKLEIRNDSIILSSAATDSGQFREELPIAQSGDLSTVGFKVKYLLDFLKAIDTEKIEFKYNGDNKPAVLKLKDQNDYQYIVMPSRL
ncbi:MAG TPA: DNA polymerase III subunit beta [Bacillota bacterium]|nr:DNA polymerase III subunit beta [Bacillota bacterium]